MKTNVSEGVERKPVLGLPHGSSELLKRRRWEPKEILLLCCLFLMAMERVSFPPGCSNSHLLTAFHAGLQLTPGRCLAMPLPSHSIPKEAFNALTYNHFKIL